MRILLIASAYNSMTQRVHAELADRGHEVSVELALGDEVMREGVRRYDPDLVIAPMLTTAIPADIWSARPCFIVHPGPRGDRGPSSLDWAIMDGAGRWGVTVLQANGGDGRRRHLGQRGVHDARLLEELRVPHRSRGRRGGGGAAGGGAVRRRQLPGRAAGLQPPRRDRAVPSALPAGRPQDRLAGRPHLLGAGQAAGGRFQPRRPGRARRRRVLPGRRARGRRPARTARHDPGPARRRDLPGDHRRGSVDSSAAPAPGPRRPESLQAAGHAGVARIAWTACRRPPRR